MSTNESFVYRQVVESVALMLMLCAEMPLSAAFITTHSCLHRCRHICCPHQRRLIHYSLLIRVCSSPYVYQLSPGSQAHYYAAPPPAALATLPSVGAIPKSPHSIIVDYGIFCDFVCVRVYCFATPVGCTALQTLISKVRHYVTLHRNF